VKVYAEPNKNKTEQGKKRDCRRAEKEKEREENSTERLKEDAFIANLQLLVHDED